MNNIEQKVETSTKAAIVGNTVLAAVCSWCGEQILVGQPTSKSYDGETMHFGCAAECDDDGDVFLGDCGS